MALTNTPALQKTSPLIKITPRNFLEDTGRQESLFKTKTVRPSEKPRFVLVPRLLDNNKVTFTSAKLQIIVVEQNKLRWI